MAFFRNSIDSQKFNSSSVRLKCIAASVDCIKFVLPMMVMFELILKKCNYLAKFKIYKNVSLDFDMTFPV